MLNFEELYETYVSDVFRFAFWIAGNSADAEDITSETFTRAWVRRDVIRTKTLKAYLFTIARNIYLGYLRKRRRQVPLEDVHTDPAPTPDRWVETRLELQKVHAVLQTLPEIDRAAFVMRVQHEFPYAEIGRALGLSVSAAKVKVHRVRKKLIASFLKKESF